MKTIRSALPREEFIIQTKKSAEEVSRILNGVIGEKMKFFIFMMTQIKAFYGKIGSDWFIIYPGTNYINHFIPVFKGKIIPKETGSEIIVSSRQRLSVRIFIVVWCLFPLIIALVLALNWSSLINVFVIPIILILPCLGWFLSLYGFWFEENKAKAKLCLLLDGTIQDTMKNPR
ncbi:hypothetical protein EOM82_09790 [bacterium]|nr:hypothetical protein [bacterium]